MLSILSICSQRVWNTFAGSLAVGVRGNPRVQDCYHRDGQRFRSEEEEAELARRTDGRN